MKYKQIAQVYIDGKPMCRRDREAYLLWKFKLMKLPLFMARFLFKIINWIDKHHPSIF